MPLAGVTKAGLRALAYIRYNEEVGGGAFTTTTVNTCVQAAAVEMSLRTGCVLGSARKARTSTSTGEAQLALPTGMFAIHRVQFLRTIAATPQIKTLRQTSPGILSVREGSGWAKHTEATSGTPTSKHAWYSVSPTRIGFYPPKMTSTAGTVILWAARAATTMNSTVACDIPTERLEGVVYLTCRRLAELDRDSDPQGLNAAMFEAKAQPYLGPALVGE